MPWFDFHIDPILLGYHGQGSWPPPSSRSTPTISPWPASHATSPLSPAPSPTPWPDASLAGRLHCQDGRDPEAERAEPRQLEGRTTEGATSHAGTSESK